MASTLQDDFLLEESSLFCCNFIRLSPEAQEQIRLWRNHPSVSAFLFTQHEISQEEHTAFIEKLKLDKARGYWMVKQHQKPLGVISLSLSQTDRKEAYLGIYTDPEARGKGYGKLLMQALKTIAFDHLKLQKLSLEVLSENLSAISFYEKMGFRESGRSRAFVPKEARHHQVIAMQILKEESHV